MIEASNSTRRAIKMHQQLVDEGLRRINNYRPSKFDRMQFERAMADGGIEQQTEVTRDLEQKILGPDFNTKALKIQYGIMKELSRVTFQQFAIYTHETAPYFIAMQLALVDRVRDLIKGVAGFGDPDSFLSSGQ